MPKPEIENFKEQITEKYFDNIYRLALSRTGNKSDAEDVTQEVFVRFLKTDTHFFSEEHAKAWLINVTINCSKNVFLSSHYKKTVPLTEDISFSQPELEELYLVVAKLPLKYRTVIHLFYYEDMSIESISKCLNLKETTVKSQLHRGRELLKTMLKDYDYE